MEDKQQDRAGALIGRLQGFILRGDKPDAHMTPRQVAAALRSLDKLLPDLPDRVVQRGAIYLD